MDGMLFDIQRFSLHDGPGIRTTLFMKGCPLRCKWCHNPEGLSPSIQLQYMEDKCIGCRKCESTCTRKVHEFKTYHQINWKACKLCGRCIDICPAQALIQCGKVMGVEEVMAIIMQDQVFYQKEGGVTLSGGEALSQGEFSVNVLKSCKQRGIGTAIDTSGHCRWEDIEKTLPYCDLYLYDIKTLDSEIHQAMTGVDNKLILSNLKRLDQENKSIWIRIPVIRQVNASDEQMEVLAQYIKNLHNVKQVTLMPYHILGKNKYITLGLTYPYMEQNQITEEELNRYKAILIKEGIILT